MSRRTARTHAADGVPIFMAPTRIGDLKRDGILLEEPEIFMDAGSLPFRTIDKGLGRKQMVLYLRGWDPKVKRNPPSVD